MPASEHARGRDGTDTRVRPGRWTLALLSGLGAAFVTGSGIAVATAGGGVDQLGGPSLAALRQQLAPSIVDTIAFGGPAGQEILGTGIILSSSGLVLTDYHVILDDGYIGVRIGGEGDVYRTAVLVLDEPDDLALLQIEGAGPVKPAALEESAAAEIGTPVMAIGNAGGLGVEPSAVPGHLVALDRAIRYGVGGMIVRLGGLMEARAAIAAGDSGGALVDSRGRVIAVIAAGSGDRPCPPDGTCSLDLAYATPIAAALAEVHYPLSG